MRLGRDTTALKSQLTAAFSEAFGVDEKESSYPVGDALKNGGCLYFEENGSPVSSLLYKPVIVRSGGREYSGRYVFGLSTSEKRRREGLATKLLSALEEESSGVSFLLLIPENDGLFGFYEQRGYIRSGYASAFEADAESAPGGIAVRRETDGELIYSAYSEAAASLGSVCLLSRSDIESNIAESSACGGGYFLTDGGCCFVRNGVICELLAPRDAIVETAATVAAFCGYAQAKVYTAEELAPESAVCVPVGLVKPLDGSAVPEKMYMNMLYNW